MTEQIWIRGENGALHVFDVPLHPGIASRLDKGDLVRVNEDGSPWTGPGPDGEDGETGTGGQPDDGDGEPAGGEDGDPPPDAPPLPPKSASRAVWTQFAVEQGMDRDKAAAMTKAQLVEEFTKSREAP